MMVQVTGHPDLSIEENVFKKYINERRYNHVIEEVEDYTDFLCYLGVFDTNIKTFSEYYNKKGIYIYYSDLLAVLSEFNRIKHIKYVLSFDKLITESGYWDYEPYVLDIYNAFINLPTFIEKHVKRVNNRKILEYIIDKADFCNDIHETIENYL